MTVHTTSAPESSNMNSDKNARSSGLGGKTIAEIMAGIPQGRSPEELALSKEIQELIRKCPKKPRI